MEHRLPGARPVRLQQVDAVGRQGLVDGARHLDDRARRGGESLGRDGEDGGEVGLGND